MATVRVGGSDIAYSDEGAGPPVVLLHGGGSNRRQWKPLAALLGDRYRVIAPDLHGHGDSEPWSQAAAPALADFGAIVPAVTAGIDGHAHVVGHSGGGAFALAHALSHLGAVASLVLIEPTLTHILPLAGRDAAWREVHEVGTRHLELVTRGEIEACADVFLPYWIGQAAWDATPPDRRAAIVATMPTVAHFWRATFAETTPLDAYAAVTAPVLLMRGAQTSRASHEIVDLLADILPNVTLVEIEDAGHMSPLTHPEEVNTAIAAFLDGAE
jgi:pimeloyl-ACP methyl ester carboxylesterase